VFHYRDGYTSSLACTEPFKATVHTAIFYKILHTAHTTFKCNAYVKEQTVNFALYSIQRLVFVSGMAGVYCVVHSGSLNTMDYILSLRVIYYIMFPWRPPSFLNDPIYFSLKLSCYCKCCMYFRHAATNPIHNEVKSE
jgi:hypothetical protein